MPGVIASDDGPGIVATRSRTRSYVIIPARLASTRLPRKLLLRDTGKSVIQHTFEAAKRASRPVGVCVAADHEEIAMEVRLFGGEVRMTSPTAASGTDRVAEAARDMADIDIVVNVQGDEPEIEPASIDRVIALLEENPNAVMATLATPIRTRERLDDPTCVKVVFDEHGRALYFSRSPIPHAREFTPELLTATPANFHQHLGLYAYRREFLFELAALPRTPLEKLENLEQLRVLENGRQILVGVVDEPTKGIDTADDYRVFVERSRTQALPGDALARGSASRPA